MKDIFKLALSLGLVCCIGASALVCVYNTTKEPIKTASAKALESNMKLVLPGETVTTEELSSVDCGNVIFYRALDAAGNVIAYAGQGSGDVNGFGGAVKVLVGLKSDGTIIGVMVTEHSETPGLGTKATDRQLSKSLWSVLAGKSEENPFPPNEYLDRYNGRKAGAFVLGSGGNGIHGVSGATYSSKAVLSGVNAVCEAFGKISK